MVILPAIDIHGGQCVRLYQGDYATAHKVAENPLQTAKTFEEQGATWLHMVDLDGAKEGRPVNQSIFLDIARQTGLKVELGGGIRDMQSIELYLNGGISRVILGSVALQNPGLVKDAVARFGEQIAVGIDAREGMVATQGWLDASHVNYLDLAREMESVGVRCIIFTDIARDGTLSGPNLQQLCALNSAVSCDIIASGGMRDVGDITALANQGMYGAICGKSLYEGTLSLPDALRAGCSTREQILENLRFSNDLIPAVVQQYRTGEVLMVAYMNRESLQKTLETGYTWFYSRSRQCLWNKGATSGHLQKVREIRTDCDFDTLLVTVEQTGAACHTGSHNCFFHLI